MRTANLRPVGRVGRLVAILASMLFLAIQQPALGVSSFHLVPLDLGDGYSIAGTIVTDGSVGPINAGNIVGWQVAVTYVNDLVYDPTNTSANLASVTASSGALRIATSPDGIDDGGTMSFMASEYFGVTIADFTWLNLPGGAASWQQGNLLALNQPDGWLYTAATSADGVHYALVPLDLGAPFSMFGTITTDGALGAIDAGNLVDWSITVRERSVDLFNEGNSSLTADLLRVSHDGRYLTVTNPEGFLTLAKGYAGGHLYGVQLADFANGDNQAGYFEGRLLAQVITPITDQEGRHIVAVSDAPPPVPEPMTAALLGSALLALTFTRRRPTA